MVMSSRYDSLPSASVYFQNHPDRLHTAGVLAVGEWRMGKGELSCALPLVPKLCANGAYREGK